MCEKVNTYYKVLECLKERFGSYQLLSYKLSKSFLTASFGSTRSQVRILSPRLTSHDSQKRYGRGMGEDLYTFG